MSFVHLHVHSHFSLLDGLPKIPGLVAKAKELGFPALALTDHGSMYGAIEFYKSCKKNGINPIIGMETYVAPRALYLKQSGIDNKNFHLTLLAKNYTGYKNLMELSTIGHIDGFYYRPRIDREVLARYSEGLICLSGCASGELRSALKADNRELALQIIADHKEIFGDDYYIELQHLITADKQYAKRQEKEMSELKLLAKECNIPVVATCDVHYLEPEDAEIQDVLVCIQTGKEVTDTKRLDMRSTDLSLYPLEKMQELFADTPEAIENTLKIAEQCDLELDLKTWHYPEFNTPKGKTDEEYLRELVEQGAIKRYGSISQESQERIDYELDIINHKRYASYFLIYADFMGWARSQGILTTARGSVSGSVVSYCLGITNVDPLKYKVPFERFLTKVRPSPPDIDSDIADSRRDDVIDYVRQKYGEDKVAQICTFGTMMARGSFRDVARALGKPAVWADQHAKMIPFGSQGFPMTLERALEESADLKAVYQQDPEVQRVYKIAQKIEGCARHVSVHAAGVVVTPSKLTDFLPLQVEPKGRHIITQYDMYAIDPNASKESVGALKMDFLGLRNLSILSLCVDIVKKVKGEDIDIYSVPVDDKKTFEMLSQGLTFGVFQMGGSGMKKYLKELKPTQVSDLMAMVALYRPGPIENIPEFIRRKNNPSLIEYPDPRLKEVLEMSYGLLVYQDDVLYTVIILAGYDPAEADAFRKAVGKKIPAEMEAQKQKFYKGCQENGLTEDKIDSIWKLIEPFAAYGFNKAHSASYGMLAYQTAYMKANYSAEYMSALMTCEAANVDKIAEAVKDCKRLGIDVLPPDVNESRDDFTYVSDTEIRFGLNAIKNLGSDIIYSIIHERKENGKYESLQDFLTRVKSKNLNKKSIEALIKAGALDSLGSRDQMYHNVDKLLQFVRYTHSNPDNSQASLFGDDHKESIILTLESGPLLPLLEKLTWEKDLLGLYVSDHPFSKFADKLPSQITSITDIMHATANEALFTAGIITSVKTIITKKGDPMAFTQIEDLSGQLEVIVFPNVYNNSKDKWQEHMPIVVSGTVNDRNGERKFIAENIQHIDPEAETVEVSIKAPANQKRKSINESGDKTNNGVRATIIPTGTVVVSISSRADSRAIQALKQIFQDNPGNYAVQLEVGTNGSTKRILTKYSIDISDVVKQSIEGIIGTNSVRMR